MAKLILNKNNISNINTGLNKEELKNRIKESESRDDLIIITDDIKSSDLNTNDKAELLKSIVIEYQNKYSELSKDYQELKKDIQFLLNDIKSYSGLTQIAFILTAERLKIIRDNELYKPEYKDFKSFFENEIDKSKPTIYFYISIIETFKELFTESNLIRLFDIEYSKLIPFLPLLKNKDIAINEKQEIKEKAIELLESELNQRDIITIAKEYKSKYGLINNDKEINIDKLVNSIIKKIPERQRPETIRYIIDKLNKMI